LVRYLRKIFDKNRDLTEGKIFHNVVYLAFPLMVGSLLQGTQSLIDMFWVGSLGASSIAAVAISGTIIMLIFTIVIGISMGTVALVSKNIGSKNKEAVDLIAGQSIFLGVVLSAVITAAALFYAKRFLILLGARGDVLSEGIGYLRILLIGNITMFLLFLGNSILQGAGDVMRPMVYMGVANICNIILDPIFIFGIGVPRMNTAGAAVATVIGQGVSAVLVLRMLYKGKSRVNINIKDFRVNTRIVREILKIGIPSSLQMFVRTTMNLAVIGMVASFGTAAIAAFGLVMRIHINTLMPAFALGGASATLVGQNLGAGRPDRARKSAWVATKLDLGIMTAFSLLLFIFAKNIMSFFNGDAEVIRLGSDFIRIAAPFYIFIAFGVVLNRALGGAGDTFVPMLITLFSLWGYLVPLSYYLSKFTPLGIEGIWWAVATSSLVNGLLTLGWFEMGRWKRRKVDHGIL